MNKKRWINVLDWVRVFALALAIALIIRVAVFEIVRVDGPSMQETLYTGQRVLIEKLVFRFTGPRRGDIVECYFGSDRSTSYIKRVIGLPGEELSIRDGRIFIDGYEYADPQFDVTERELNYLEGTWQIPEGEYFLMGDNRLDSTDSRSAAVGCVPRNNILGRGVLRVWPFDTITVLR